MGVTTECSKETKIRREGELVTEGAGLNMLTPPTSNQPIV